MVNWIFKCTAFQLQMELKPVGGIGWELWHISQGLATDGCREDGFQRPWPQTQTTPLLFSPLFLLSSPRFTGPGQDKQHRSGECGPRTIFILTLCTVIVLLGQGEPSSFGQTWGPSRVALRQTGCHLSLTMQRGGRQSWSQDGLAEALTFGENNWDAKEEHCPFFC